MPGQKLRLVQKSAPGLLMVCTLVADEASVWCKLVCFENGVFPFDGRNAFSDHKYRTLYLTKRHF